MQMIREMTAAIFGFGAGLLAAGGIFALISTVNILPRLAQKSATKDYIMLYENMVALGGTVGSVISLTELSLPLGRVSAAVISSLFVLFAGIFVGCLATALAETINTIPVFLRRAKIYKGLGYIVLVIAMGKIFGDLLQCYMGWFF